MQEFLKKVIHKSQGQVNLNTNRVMPFAYIKRITNVCNQVFHSVNVFDFCFEIDILQHFRLSLELKNEVQWEK